MNSKRQITKQLEELYQDPNNSQCFDCDNKPAHWASITNGIYLCLDCSGEHRGFGVGVSFIKSVTMDQWTQKQVNLMKVGGNQRLKDFLINYEMPENLDKKRIYCSKLMSFYRRQLKAESLGQLFMEPLPPKEEFWAPLDEDLESQIFNTNKKSDNNNNNFFSSNDNYLSNKPEYDKMPKNEIIISEDQYEKARRQAEISEKISNPIPSEPKFSSVSSSNKDARYGSVGSDPVNNSGGGYFSGIIGNSGYLGTVGNILGTVWGAGCTVASGIASKMNEYSVGSKILYVGGKTVEGITYVGGKIIEKGGEILTSDAVKNMASKTGESIVYLKDKLTGNTGGSNSGGSGNYSSTSSDNYYNSY